MSVDRREAGTFGADPAMPRARVLLVGAGGLGSPAAIALARAGVSAITLVDDDAVDASNLHRQTLYDEANVGERKGEAAARALVAVAREAGRDIDVGVIHGRVLPDNAIDLAKRHDLVIEGADNFATKFLVADAAALARVPSVQAGAVRWNGWALASIPGESACLRCVFEDIPRDRPETCAEAGVVGPVVGVLGALSAGLAVRLLAGDRSAAGVLWGYRGLAGALRRSRVRKRADCPLCEGRIDDVRLERYVGPDCAA
jgi:adenylyltransferase/sulfurtransferase